MMLQTAIMLLRMVVLVVLVVERKLPIDCDVLIDRNSVVVMMVVNMQQMLMNDFE